MERRKLRRLGKKINEENYENYEIELNNYIKSKTIEILEKLKFMNLSEQELEDNIWFYIKNCEKLIKINDIIKNINSSNVNNLSPQEVLEIIVPENKLKNSNKNLDDNGGEKKEINETQINPDYVAPNKWRDLFKLEISDKIIDNLYIGSKIMILAKEYSFWKNIDKWQSIIDKNNYQKYQEEFEAQKKDELSNYNKLKKALPQYKCLEYYHKSEDEIRSNIDYYYNNLKEIIKIDNIIKTAKIGNLYHLTPSEAYRKVTSDNPNHLKLPDKWEDLFNLTVPEWKTDILYATTKNYIKNMEFEKNRIESNRLHEENYRFSGLNKNGDDESNNNNNEKKNFIKRNKKIKIF